MFLVSVFSGIAGLLLGWSQLYKDYLSKTVELPVWLFIVGLICIPLILVAVRGLRKTGASDSPVKVEGKKFGVQRINVDGKSFERCEFHGSELLFSGEQPFGLAYCRLEPLKITFIGSAATTVAALANLYQDPAFRPIVDQTIHRIKSNQLQHGAVPTPI